MSLSNNDMNKKDEDKICSQLKNSRGIAKPRNAICVQLRLRLASKD